MLVFGASLFLFIQEKQKMKVATQQILTETKTLDEFSNRVTSNLLFDLASSDEKILSLNNYLTMSNTDYLNYTYQINDTFNEDLYIPLIVKSFLTHYPEIKKIVITLDGVEKDLLADTSGIQRIPIKNSKQLFQIKENEYKQIRAISYPYSKEIIGTIAVFFEKNSLTLNDTFFQNITIYDNQQQLLYLHRFASPKGVPADQNLESRMYPLNDLSIQLTSNKNQVIKNIRGKVGLLILIGMCVILLSPQILVLVFNNYSKQIEEIMETTSKIGSGEFKNKIDTSSYKYELKDIGEAINQMIVSLDSYIEQVYSLELQQKEVEMAALQSQINPHFLANTLEYIRMFAVTKQQDELADIIYTFSSLLSNNISQDKMTTLTKEIEFCEKYISLYKLRFPETFCYLVSIKTQTDILLPKFTLQPLIENYFVHGIDFEREDNRLELTISQENDHLIIEISDNGQGMTSKRQKEVLVDLSNKKKVAQQHVGLKNVHDRLCHTFGERYDLKIVSESCKGTSIRITLKMGGVIE